jgi:hypothetical protein
MRQRCSKACYTGEGCGLKFIWTPQYVQRKCQICCQIEVKTRRIRKLKGGIRRWSLEAEHLEGINRTSWRRYPRLRWPNHAAKNVPNYQTELPPMNAAPPFCPGTEIDNGHHLDLCNSLLVSMNSTNVKRSDEGKRRKRKNRGLNRRKDALIKPMN